MRNRLARIAAAAPSTLPRAVLLVTALALAASGFSRGGPLDAIEQRFTFWFDIVAAFALIGGARHVVSVHFERALAREAGSRDSVVALGAFLVTLAAGLFKLGAPSWDSPVLEQGLWFRLLFDAVYAPAQAALLALVAFALAAGLYRAARLRPGALGLVLASACVVVASNGAGGFGLARDSGAEASAAGAGRCSWFAQVSGILVEVPVTAGLRALLIAAAVGLTAFAMKVLTRADSDAHP
jgi:hypothetical protein